MVNHFTGAGKKWQREGSTKPWKPLPTWFKARRGGMDVREQKDIPSLMKYESFTESVGEKEKDRPRQRKESE